MFRSAGQQLKSIALRGQMVGRLLDAHNDINLNFNSNA